MRAASKRVSCPRCSSETVRLSGRAGFIDGAAVLLLLVPLRCRKCRLRFYRPWFVARRARVTGASENLISTSVLVSRSIPAPVVRQRILLVDDDPALRKLLTRLLKSGGYEVCEASDSGAAMAELRGAKMDLVVVNLGTGDEGEKAAQELSRAYPELIIVVLSETVGLAETSEKLLILPKPSRAFAVVQSIRQVLTNERQTGSGVPTTLSPPLRHS